MGDSYADLLKLITAFGWRQWLVLVTLAAATLLGFFLYEYYTASHRLARLERTIELVEKIQKLDQAGTNKMDLDLILKSTVRQLTLASVPTPPNSQIPIARVGPSATERGVAAGFVLLAFFGYQLFKTWAKPSDQLITLQMIACFAISSAAAGILVPAIAWPYVHIIGIPVGLLLLVAGLGFCAVLVFKVVVKRKLAKAAESGKA